MAEIILDLSGQKGLADNFHGDTDMITPRPELRISKTEGDLVSGLFNPYLRSGYLAPLTTASTSLTTSTTLTTPLISVEYDNENEDIYWCDSLISLFTSSSLTDTSITLVYTLEHSTYAGLKYDALYDLQMYQINGVRKLFFVGKGMPLGGGPVTSIAVSDTVSDNWITGALSIIPFSTTKPSIVSTARNFTAGAATSTTQSFTVPSGTNQALFVFAFIGTSSSSSPTATFNGVSMSVVATSNYGPSLRMFKLANPTVTTANVVVTWPGSEDNRLIYIVLTNNTDQTEIADGDLVIGGAADATSDRTFQIPFTDVNALNIVGAYSDGEMSVNTTNHTHIYNDSNTFGSDILSKRSETGYGLQVGYSDIPVSSLDSSRSSWMASQAINGFIQSLSGDYAFMRTADNGYAYVFADNHVHKIDGNTTGGTTGSATKDVVLFPDYFRITDAVDYRSRMYIAVHQYPVSVADTSLNTYTGKCGLYVWNRISTQLGGADYIELPGVREIKKIYVSPDGNLKLITIADNGLTQLREFGYNDSGGVVFPVFKTLGIGAYPQFPDGLTTAGDKVTWLANDGNIYCEKAKTVTKIFQVKTPGATTATLESNISSGILFYGNGDETADSGYRSNKQALTFSYLDGATHYVKKIYPFDLKDGSNSTQAQHQGDVYTGVTLLPMHSVLRSVRVYNAPTTSVGTTVVATVKLYFNQSSTASMTKTITQSEAKRGYVDFSINKPYIHAVQVEIEWATGINLGNDTYLPSAAIISYDQTKAKSPDNG